MAHDDFVRICLDTGIHFKIIVWASSDENVATVTGGVVTAHNYGEAVITAKVGVNEATCTVAVNPEELIPTEIMISGEFEVEQELTFDITGNQEIAACTFYITQKNKIYYFDSNTSSKSFSFTPRSSGIYTAVALVFDMAGDGILYTIDFEVN